MSEGLHSLLVFGNVRQTRILIERSANTRVATDGSHQASGLVVGDADLDPAGCDGLGRTRHRPSLSGLVRHAALTWMADAGVDLHILRWRVAGHQDPAVTSRYLHPDTQAMLDAGTAFSTWWSKTGPERPALVSRVGNC